MDLALLILILQIGFNAAINYRQTNRIAMIPASRLFNHELSRRSLSHNRYLRPSDSNSEQSDFDYSSEEESSSYRSLNSFKRRKNPTQYDTKADNEASLELPPGRLGSDNRVEPLDAAAKDKDYRRPYLSHITPIRRHGLTSTPDIKDLEDVVYRGATNYLKLLFTIMEEKNNRRNLNDNRKVPINNLATSRANIYDSRFVQPANSRRLNLEDRKSYATDSSYYQPLPIRRVGNNDAALFIPHESISNTLIALRSKLRIPEPVKLKHKSMKASNRRDDDDDDDNVDDNGDDDEDDYDYEYQNDDSVELPSGEKVKADDEIMKNYIQSFIEIRPLIESLLATYDNANKNNETVTLEALLEKLKEFTNLVEEDVDDTKEVKSLRLSDLQDFKSPELRSHDGKLNHRQKDNKNTLRFLISPLDKVTLDEDKSSDFSEKLADLKVVPVSLRVGIPINKKYRREQTESIKRQGPQVMRFGTSYNLNADTLILRNLKQTLLNNLQNRKNYKNLKTNLRHQTSHHKLGSLKRQKHRRSKHNHKNDDDRFNALYNDREDDYDSDSDDSFEDLSVARSTGNSKGGSNETHPNQENTTDIFAKENDNETNVSLEHITSAEEEDNDYEVNATLQLEYPWNGQLSPSDYNKSNTSSDNDIEEFLRSYDSKHKSEDYALNLEYPWSSSITPGDNKSNNRTALRKDQSREDQTLDLEYPWNSVINPEDNTSSEEIADNKKDASDSLQLDFPDIDDQLRSHKKRKGKDKKSEPKQPVKSKASPDKGISTENIPTRSSDPLYEYPFLRQTAHQNDQRPLNDNKDSFLRQSDNKSNLRQPGNQNEHNLAQNYLRDNTKQSDNSDDDDDGQAFMMVPLDRRPHPRLRTNVMPYLFDNLGPQLRSSTYNDTIIFPND